MLNGDAVAALVVFIEFGGQHVSKILLQVRHICGELQVEDIHSLSFSPQGDQRRGRDLHMLVLDVEWNLYWWNFERERLIRSREAGGKEQHDE